MDKIGMAIFSGAMVFTYVMMAIYSMLFTSGTPFIKMENITKIVISDNNLTILVKESGRIKNVLST